MRETKMNLSDFKKQTDIGISLVKMKRFIGI